MHEIKLFLVPSAKTVYGGHWEVKLAKVSSDHFLGSAIELETNYCIERTRILADNERSAYEKMIDKINGFAQ